MMEKKNADGQACSVFLWMGGLAFVVYLIYQITQFFQWPDAIPTLINDLKAVGLCLGMVVLFFAVIIFAGRLQARPSFSSLKQASPDYALRCEFMALEKTTGSTGPAALPEEREGVPLPPIYLIFSITNLGLCLWPKNGGGFVPADNPSRFLRLSGGTPDPVLFPASYCSVHYIFTREGEAGEMRRAPNREPALVGSITEPPQGYQVKMVLVASAIQKTGNLDRTLYRDLTVTLELAAVDENGHEDPAATREVYQAAEAYLRSANSQDDDDDWMYHSRPIYW